jgi:hypothetical protein
MTTTARGSGGTRRVFDGDATVDGVLGASGLPRELQDLVRLVVSRCRLSKREKSQAAAMLCDRFAEQLGAGRTVQQITGELGEPRVVARTLSRDVRRNRSLSVRIFRRGVQGVVLCLLLLIAAYGYYFVRFNFGTPNIARNFAQEHNDRVLARPEAERAWPVYRRVMSGWTHLQFTEEEGTQDYPDLKPGTPGWDAAAANLKANATGLAEIRRAAKLPAMGFPLREEPDPVIEAWLEGRAPTPGGIDPPASVANNPPLYEIDVVPLRFMREFGFALKFDALVAVQQGDGRRVVDNIGAMLGMGRQLRDSEIMLADFASQGVSATGIYLIGTVLQRHASVLTDEHLAELAAMLEPPSDGSNPYSVRFTMERSRAMDVLQRMYSDDGDGRGILLAEAVRKFDLMNSLAIPGGAWSTALLGPLLSAIGAGRAELWERFESEFRAAERLEAMPLWERQSGLPKASGTQGGFQRMRTIIVEIMLISMDRPTTAGEFMLQERDAMRTALALERHRRTSGQWPATLRELVPAYLPEVPPDRYTGKALGYVLLNGQPRIYSVGVDRIDDGGRPLTGENTGLFRIWISPREAAARVAALQGKSAEAGEEDIRGDWILWPALERPPANETSGSEGGAEPADAGN